MQKLVWRKSIFTSTIRQKAKVKNYMGSSELLKNLYFLLKLIQDMQYHEIKKTFDINLIHPTIFHYYLLYNII